MLLILVGGLTRACAPPPPTHQAPPPRELPIPSDAVKMSPDSDPTPPILHVGGWQAPIPVPGDVNTAGAEDSRCVTPDGGTLHFFFAPDPSIPAEKQLLDGVTGICVARREGDAWGRVECVLLQEPGKLALDGWPTVAGDTLWFCSAREGHTGVNTFTAQVVEGGWGDVQYAGDLLTQEYGAGELHVVGNEMYYHSPRAGGKGQFDIWVTRHVGVAAAGERGRRRQRGGRWLALREPRRRGALDAGLRPWMGMSGHDLAWGGWATVLFRDNATALGVGHWPTHSHTEANDE